MKKFVFLVMMLLAVSTTLFAQNNNIQGASVSKFEATQLTNNGNLFVVPLVSELKVLKNKPTAYAMQQTFLLPDIRKKEKTEQYMIRLENFIKEKIEELKAQALYEFIDSENASLIISPIYSIKTVASRGNSMTVEVNIKGYPAIYTNFRNLQASDTTLIKWDRRIIEHIPAQVDIDEKKIQTTEREEKVKRN